MNAMSNGLEAELGRLREKQSTDFVRSEFGRLLAAIAKMQSQVGELAAEVKQMRADRAAELNPPTTGLRRKMSRITERTAAAHGVQVSEIMGRRRFAPLSLARAACFYECHRAGISWMDTARFYRVDHTSVMKGSAKAERLILAGIIEALPETEPNEVCQ